MNDWIDFPEYNDINNQIDIITSRIDRISKLIDQAIVRTGEEPESLTTQYNELCDERMKLIEKRHEIASKLFP